MDGGHSCVYVGSCGPGISSSPGRLTVTFALAIAPHYAIATPPQSVQLFLSHCSKAVTRVVSSAETFWNTLQASYLAARERVDLFVTVVVTIAFDSVIGKPSHSALPISGVTMPISNSDGCDSY